MSKIRYSIVVADDESDIVNSVTEQLTRIATQFGHQLKIFKALSAIDVITTLSTYNIDALFLDYHFEGGLSGDEIIDEIDDIFNQKLIILMSGRDQKEIESCVIKRHKGLGDRFKFLRKPFDYIELQTAYLEIEKFFSRFSVLFPYINSYPQNTAFYWLPEKIRYSFCSGLDPQNIESYKAQFLGGIEAFLGYLYDYHIQTVDGEGFCYYLHLEALINKCDKILGTNKQITTSEFSELNNELANLIEAENINTFATVCNKICSILFRLVTYFPLIVEIRSNEFCVEELIFVEAFPTWTMKDSGLDLDKEKLCIFVKAEETPYNIKTGFFYLPPSWHNGNQLSYFVTKDSPLIKVCYIPRWGFWEMCKKVLALTRGGSIMEVINVINDAKIYQEVLAGLGSLASMVSAYINIRRENREMGSKEILEINKAKEIGKFLNIIENPLLNRVIIPEKILYSANQKIQKAIERISKAIDPSSDLSSFKQEEEMAVAEKEICNTVTLIRKYNKGLVPKELEDIVAAFKC
ncbi:MAG: hypothetical protein IPK14_12115 [Blastocatellia bacterium]|nr:hypothetical protein [Blastocatellia bacterium]